MVRYHLVTDCESGDLLLDSANALLMKDMDGDGRCPCCPTSATVTLEGFDGLCENVGCGCVNDIGTDNSECHEIEGLDGSWVIPVPPGSPNVDPEEFVWCDNNGDNDFDDTYDDRIDLCERSVAGEGFSSPWFRRYSYDQPNCEGEPSFVSAKNHGMTIYLYFDQKCEHLYMVQVFLVGNEIFRWSTCSKPGASSGDVLSNQGTFKEDQDGDCLVTIDLHELYLDGTVTVEWSRTC